MGSRISVVTLLVAGLLAGCGERPETGAALDQAASTPPASPVPGEFTSLKGKWARTDGDYTLEIREVSADGKMEAAYFNPGPIHVSKAFAIKESSGTKVFVELQDTGYPGCTYSLNFDTATTQLHGQYFQAAMQQTYDVVFARVQE